MESSEAKKPEEGATMYAEAPIEPVLQAVDGILFDFNVGLRIKTPDEGGPWRIVFGNADDGLILFDGAVEKGSFFASKKKFYQRFFIKIWREADVAGMKPDERPAPLFEHVMDFDGRDVIIQLPVSTIGDSLGWVGYTEKFREAHPGVHVHVVVLPFILDLVARQYPEMHFITPGESASACIPYATYYLGLFFKGDTDNQPEDHRNIGLHRTAGAILGVDITEVRPRLDLSAPRTIKEPYVCIAVQASAACKLWNNPTGWHEVIRFLKESGYRVLCIDRDIVTGAAPFFNRIPWGVEDFTGPRPLQERVDLLRHADFFIGPSSGLAWLAWGAGCPVVLISGFTLPSTEFHTPYRVINYNGCTGCWNDMRENFDHTDYFWCPRHKGTDSQYECGRVITGTQVINTIKRIPAWERVSRAFQSK